MDSFTKKQLDHHYAQETRDNEGGLTIYALGGFVQDRNDKIEHWFKPGLNDIDDENEYRLILVRRINEFLNALRSSRCSVKKACDVSGMTRTLADTLRLKIPTFNHLWTEIYAEVTDDLEDAAIDRAINGVSKGIYYLGDKVADEKIYSDSLMTFLLQGRRSEVYKSRLSQEVTVGPKESIPTLDDFYKTDET